MRLLLDECVPERFKEDIPGHDVHTVREMGWSSKHNGELLDLMRDHRFDCLVTVDQNIEYQQNVVGRSISVIIILARRNRLDEIRRAVTKVLLALANIQPGQLVRITA